MQSLEHINLYDWSTIEPYFTALQDEQLTSEKVPAWLKRWGDLQQLVWEARSGLKRDRARDLLNETAQQAFQDFAETVFTPFQVANEQLAAKLLSLTPYEPAPEHSVTLRYLRATTNSVSSTTPDIQSAIEALTTAYNMRVAGMTVELDGQQLDGTQVYNLQTDPDRATREALWRARQRPWQHDRVFFDQLFLDLIAQRRRLAETAGMPDYRAYRWRELGRIDYTSDDCLRFHAAIADELVPVVARWHEARRQGLGVSTLRPWDVDGAREEHSPQQPFATVEAFEAGMATVFQVIDPELGMLFSRMRSGFLDLGWRKGKLEGGEEWLFPVTGLPYVHLNADGTTNGVWALLHEMGHAFHDYRTGMHQHLLWDTWYPDEFAECAAMTNSLLGGDYLSVERGGCYTASEAAQLVGELLKHFVEWPIKGAMIDAFQHWIYTEAPADVQPADLDAQWLSLSQRFAPWIDWSGLEAEHAAEWHKERLVYGMPFYNISYDFAELGALQIWRKAQQDRPATWQAFREALALGNTRSLPELFTTAGAQFPFEREALRDLAETVDQVLRDQAQ
jgi:oligoendopeptidase F